jgi:hypothetical protein
MPETKLGADLFAIRCSLAFIAILCVWIASRV